METLLIVGGHGLRALQVLTPMPYVYLCIEMYTHVYSRYTHAYPMNTYTMYAHVLCMSMYTHAY